MRKITKQFPGILANEDVGLELFKSGVHLFLVYAPGWTENITGGRGWIVIALVVMTWVEK